VPGLAGRVPAQPDRGFLASTAIATIVGIGVAVGQEPLPDPRPLCECNTVQARWPDQALKKDAEERAERSLQRITGWPAVTILPVTLGQPAAKPIKYVLHNEPGGLIHNAARWLSTAGASRQKRTTF
jgi:hypothetical protein